MAAFVLFLASIVQFTGGQYRFLLAHHLAFGLSWPYQLVITRAKAADWIETRWETAILQSVICLAAGWLLWRASDANSGHGAKLLAGAFTLLALNNMDRPQWTHEEMHLFRFAFDHFLNASLGIGMIVLLVGSGPNPLRGNQRKNAAVHDADRFQQSIRLLARTAAKGPGPDRPAASAPAMESIRLLEGKGDAKEFVVRASVGFSETYLKQMASSGCLVTGIQSVIRSITTSPDLRLRKIRKFAAAWPMRASRN